MKTLTITKKNMVSALAEDIGKGIMGFQVVEFVINYFGNKIVCEHDTRIMKDGRQFVIGGDGFIKDGYEIRHDS